MLLINERLKKRAKEYPEIEYSGSEYYPVKVNILKKLINKVPDDRDIFKIAAYYLKNIILLQAFPDGNHRTALFAVEIFLQEMNGYSFDYEDEEALLFRKKCYKKRGEVYGTYEEMLSWVLEEKDNQIKNEVYSLCLEFIKFHVK